MKTVLKALFPEKTAKIGQKRKLEVKQEVSEAEDRIYRINYKQVCISRALETVEKCQNFGNFTKNPVF